MGQRDEGRDSALALALTAVGGFAVGLVAGTVLGGSVGNLHAERVRGAWGRLRRTPAEPQPEELERQVRAALRADEATSDLDIEVHAAGPGLIELTGIVSDALARRVAGDLARGVPGVDVVVNRILLRGSDLPPTPASPATRGG